MSRPMIPFVFFVFVTVLGRLETNAQNSPFEFVQRDDVGRELRMQPEQIRLVQELQPVCDAQCQARIMEMLTSTSTELQTQFLALGAEGQQVAVQRLDQTIREGMESEMLDNLVLTSPQFERFQQLRTQFMGLESLLSDRVGGLLGLSNRQSAQLRELQNFGGELIGMCGQDSSLSPEQQQAGIQNIQNVIIDQSVNILNDSQIQIFAELCGNRCQFDDDPVGGESPMEGSPANENVVGADLETNQPEAQPAIPATTSTSAVTPTTITTQPQSAGVGGAVRSGASQGGSRIRRAASPANGPTPQSGSSSSDGSQTRI